MIQLVGPSRYDGMVTASADGRVCRVFAPPWWAVWRWIWWAFFARGLRLVERRLGLKVRLIVEAERAS